ncbi:MAG: hypothetical protein KIT79_15555 [Deltaproteobacteria bacterium]|nr:hypothetical protein [Deltaproteobacteria bacterium]
MLPEWFIAVAGFLMLVTLLAVLLLVKRSQSHARLLETMERRLDGIEGGIQNLGQKSDANSVSLDALSPTLQAFEYTLRAIEATLTGDLRNDLKDTLLILRNDLWLKLEHVERDIILRSVGEYLDRRFSRLEADLYLLHLRDMNRYLLEKGRITEAEFQSTLDRLNRLGLDDSRAAVLPLQKLSEMVHGPKPGGSK